MVGSFGCSSVSDMVGSFCSIWCSCFLASLFPQIRVFGYGRLLFYGRWLLILQPLLFFTPYRNFSLNFSHWWEILLYLEYFCLKASFVPVYFGSGRPILLPLHFGHGRLILLPLHFWYGRLILLPIYFGRGRLILLPLVFFLLRTSFFRPLDGRHYIIDQFCGIWCHYFSFSAMIGSFCCSSIWDMVGYFFCSSIWDMVGSIFLPLHSGHGGLILLPLVFLFILRRFSTSWSDIRGSFCSSWCFFSS